MCFGRVDILGLARNLCGIANAFAGGSRGSSELEGYVASAAVGHNPRVLEPDVFCL